MASVINTNSLSLVTQRNLSQSQGALGTAIARLSSGLRINGAADDAAGQAIANRFTAQINGLQIAQRNANDGISLAQTTEGAINQVNDNLQRIRELAVQAANGTLSASDKSSIQQEIDQRLSEVDRISSETTFNGVEVLASNQKISIQVGSEDGQQIAFNTKQLDTAGLGLAGFSVSDTAVAKSDQLSVVDNGSGTAVNVDLTNAASTLSDVLGETIDTDDLSLRAVVEGDGFTNEGDPTGYYVVEYDGQNYLADLNAGAVDVVTADVYGGGGTTQVEAVQVGLDAAGTGYTTFVKDQVTGDIYTGNAAQLSDDIGSAESGGTGAGAGGITNFDFSAQAAYTGAATVDPLEKLDDALATVDSLRGELGAAQNRFKSAISNLSATANNLSSARSRIEDADYAVEVSNLTRAQILQQAGTSVLAQANQVPQGVLGLLR